MVKSNGTTDLLDCISNSWISIFGSMTILALDGENGMRAKEVDDWAMHNQVILRYKAPRQKVWFVERHNVLLRSIVQRVESQAFKQSLCVSFEFFQGWPHTCTTF